MTLAQEIVVMFAVPVVAVIGIILCGTALIVIRRKEKRNGK